MCVCDSSVGFFVSLLQASALVVVIMLPTEPIRVAERSHLRLTFNRSFSEPTGGGGNQQPSGHLGVALPSSEVDLMASSQSKKRLYLQLQHKSGSVCSSSSSSFQQLW